ncbi:MAG: hypothetical protein LBE56_11690, partial [Tannerella sp.]|nr:hypothetical protein [Tannerella sp.]
PDSDEHSVEKRAIDRNTVLSIGFLTGSILLALFLFFYKPATEGNKNEVAQIPDSSVIEPYITVVEPDMYTRPSTGSMPSQNSPIPDFTGKKKDPEVITTPPETKTPVRDAPKEKKEDDKAKEKAEAEAKAKAKAEADAKAKADADAKARADAAAKAKQQTPVTEKEAVSSEKRAETTPARETGAVESQIVINRGTQIEVRLDSPLDYETAIQGARVSLTVAAPLVRSDRTVVNTGAKATAIVHKDTRRKELTLEMVETESVEGQKLRCFNTKYSARQFQRNEAFKMYLEWNRVRVKN